ncbi:MAG: homocysteine S-methyltransferase family protein, partial [Deltaproteobacteria bacterium]|nr:homocysteine S-methyltransferase family protein [Deltaproteobacteria bacterium]
MPAGVCPEQWCMNNPGIARAIAAEYRAAGADIVSTPTFGGNGIKLAQYGLGDVRRINGTLARNLRDFLGDDAFIAGDIGPTGRFVDPFGDLPFEEAVALFKEQIAGLLEGDVDLFIIETMMDIQEVRAALIALRELTDAFVIASLTVEAGGRTLTGVDPLAALITLQSLGADAVGLNCSVGPREMTGLIGALKPYATAPLVAK